MISQRKQHCWKGMCVGGKGLHTRQTAIPSGSCRQQRAEEDPCKLVSVLNLQQNAALLTSSVLWRMWIPSDMCVWFFGAADSLGLCSLRQISPACFVLFPFANVRADWIQLVPCLLNQENASRAPWALLVGQPCSVLLEEPWATSS